MVNPLHPIVSVLNTALYDFYIVPLFLIVAGVFLSVRLGFPQVRYLIETFRVTREKPLHKHGISSFAALMVSTASRVGTGNIVGVSSAICLGGPGAIFWMWVIAILGAASAFVESTLAQIYKRHDDVSGHSYGGPSYYIHTALGKRWLGVLFSGFVLLTYIVGYNLLASYNIQDSLTGYKFYDKASTPFIVGFILAALFAFCIWEGAKKISTITSYLVPFMGTIYVIVAFGIIIYNISNVPAMFGTIFKNAFSFDAGFGGFAGSCIMYGIKRGLYSNEAGMGSAPNASASASVSHPVKQGLVQSLSVFIDTPSRASCNRSPYSSTRSSSAPPQPSCASRPTSNPARTFRESFTYKSLSPPSSAATAPFSSHSPCASLATPHSSGTTTTPKAASASS